MNLHYLTGVALGVFGGILTQFGQLLEKRVVNQVRIESQENDFLRRLLKSPIWVSGVIFGLGGGTAAYMLAQSMIGPALTPGLMASGLVVLAVGSMRMNHENLNTCEDHWYWSDDFRYPLPRSERNGDKFGTSQSHAGKPCRAAKDCRIHNEFPPIQCHHSQPCLPYQEPQRDVDRAGEWLPCLSFRFLD